MALLSQLSDKALSSPSGRGLLTLNYVLANSQVLKALENNNAFELAATQSQWTPYDPTGTAKTREFGSDYSDTAYALPTKQSLTLANHYDQHSYDVSVLEDIRRGLASANDWEIQLKAKVINFAKAWDVLAMKGDGQSGEMTGLATILDGTDLAGYTGITRVVNAKDYSLDTNPTSLDITGMDNDEGLFKSLIENIGNVPGANAILMPARIWSKLSYLLFAKNVVSSVDTLTGGMNAAFNIPVYIMPSTAITLSEEDDATTPNTDTTSIYIAKFGEGETSLVTNSGLYYVDYDDPYNTTASGKEVWEIRSAWKIANPDSILRIRNYKVA